MIHTERSAAKKVGTAIVIIAIILLIGILLITYSYYQNNNLVLYLGLIITLGGVISGIYRIVILGKI
jgi:hypothetical protein